MIKSFIILGASFETGNLGVNALAWSSIRVILEKYPYANILMVGGSKNSETKIIKINGVEKEIMVLPLRFCPNLFVPDHIFRLGLVVVLCNFVPTLMSSLYNKCSIIGAILRCDVICDITGGDSFSDIYGITRLLRGYLLKRVCQLTKKPFILLPQTYGPFKSHIARWLARTTLARSAIVYSRDKEGVKIVEELIGPSSNIKLMPDVAFIMEAKRPDTYFTADLERMKGSGMQIIGLNISGLLYNGGYTRANMFGLACEYRELIVNIICLFVGLNQQVLLVPHVLPSADFSVEDDLIAAREVWENLPAEIQDKVVVVERGYDQNEIKYIIGLCDFFLGSRMHATIAAISQGIPAVALAYSRKFIGVFEMARVKDCVLDLRSMNNKEVVEGIYAIYGNRQVFHEVLEKTVPDLKNQLLGMFDGIKITLKQDER